ncbi:IS701 family transposase [Pendulispora albinea]|uniref:IS701 family transposase n=1 Tax=Pendulispora albinea TaxID=2741071 RepID=A0ABZ2LTH3_9BACT
MSSTGWEQRFDRFLEPFLAAWRTKKRRYWAPLYLRGLLLPGERKSIEPLAERVAPGHEQELRHFVSESAWDAAAVEEVLWEKADALLGADDAFLIIDDTALPKKGSESVGVAHQYCGALGKQANCQCLVSVTLANDIVPLPLSLQLYVPMDWAADPERRAKVGIPDNVVFREKWRIAIDEVRRLRKAGVRFGTVLADAGYGHCTEFREALSSEGLLWALGVQSTQQVYPANVKTKMPARIGNQKHPIPSHPVDAASEMIQALGDKGFKKVTWRTTTTGRPMSARFARCRVAIADGKRTGVGCRLPGTEAWLVCEERANGEKKYYLTNHPTDASLRKVVGAIKARWSCEEAQTQTVKSWSASRWSDEFSSWFVDRDIAA